QDGKTYDAVTGGITRIELLNQGLRTYQSELVNDSLAAQRVEVSVITFGSSVETIIPFVTAQNFVPPTLTANGVTQMGAGILKAIEAITERKKAYRQN